MSLTPKQLEKSSAKLSTPVSHPRLERGVPVSQKNFQKLFTAVLRDPSPITRHSASALYRDSSEKKKIEKVKSRKKRMLLS